MSESSKTFTLSNVETAQSEAVKPSSEVRTFKLNELIIDTSSKTRGFTYESETARNFDDLNVKKAKEGVKEVLKDALDKAKRQVSVNSALLYTGMAILTLGATTAVFPGAQSTDRAIHWEKASFQSGIRS